MPVYRVISKESGKTVYAYNADAAVDWSEYPFTGYTHLEVVQVNDDGSINANDPTSEVTKREFIKRFTVTEYATIKAAAEQNATLDYYWQMFMLAENIHLDDADTIAGVQMLEQAGLIGAGRAAEILA